MANLKRSSRAPRIRVRLCAWSCGAACVCAAVGACARLRRCVQLRSTVAPRGARCGGSAAPPQACFRQLARHYAPTFGAVPRRALAQRRPRGQKGENRPQPGHRHLRCLGRQRCDHRARTPERHAISRSASALQLIVGREKFANFERAKWREETKQRSCLSLQRVKARGFERVAGRL